MFGLVLWYTARRSPASVCDSCVSPVSASGGTGWQTGKIRIRFEFVPDVLDEPELSPDSNSLAPLPDFFNPE